MSLAGDAHLPTSVSGAGLPLVPVPSSTLIDVGEAGIFSTISVPTVSAPPLEPASTILITEATQPLDTIPSTIVSGTISQQTASAGSAGVSAIEGLPSAQDPVSTASPTASSALVPSVSISVQGANVTDGPSATIISDSSDISASPSDIALTADGQTSTLFTTIPATSTLLVSGVEKSAGSAPHAGSEHMVNNANILKPESKLFPLGIVVVIVGSIVMIAIGALVAWKLSRCRKRNKLGDRILSFSPNMRGATPYPFDAKSMNDVESRYPTRPRRIDLNDDQPSPPVGIASTRPLRLLAHPQGIDGYYNSITRANPAQPESRPDTFTCAMYPAGTCPLEYERERQNQEALGLVKTGPGSPVPSFNTGRLSDTAETQVHARPSGRRLTPPHPRYKSKHVPPPLLITPSFNQNTNSVRGFTPRRSNTNSTVSSSSAYTAL